MHVRVSTNRYVYEFDLERRVTVIRGDSGTGKTLLANLLVAEPETGVHVECERSFVLMNNNIRVNYSTWFKDYDNVVFILDEDSRWLRDRRFYDAALDSGAWLLVMDRSTLLTTYECSVESVMRLKVSGKYRTLEKLYTHKSTTFPKDWPVFTEDIGSGYSFMQKVRDKVAPLGGKDLLDNLTPNELYGKIYFMDGAAYGHKLHAYYNDWLKGRIEFILPESFEWVLLHSPQFSQYTEVRNMLADPVAYGANKTEYKTWENFFTWFIHDFTTRMWIKGYSKTSDIRCFTEPCCAQNRPCDLKYTRTKDKVLDTLEACGLLNLYNKDNCIVDELWEKLPKALQQQDDKLSILRQLGLL